MALPATLPVMFGDHLEAAAAMAAEACDRLRELEQERQRAVDTGIAALEAHVHELELEIEAWSEIYVTALYHRGRREIVTVRSELQGTYGG